MDVLAALKQRQSVRAFLDQDVPRQLLEQLFDAARWAPSAVNTQPWQVHLLSGNRKQALSESILAARHQQEEARPDYNYYPGEWVEPYRSRRKSCGLAMYSALDIHYEEKDKRLKQWDLNYQFFNAPVGLIFVIESHLAKGSWMDIGMFLQNVMTAAVGLGLASCPQAALAEYPDLVRQHLQLEQRWHIVCGMALGFADLSHPVNQYRTERADLTDFLHWHE